MAMNAIRKLFAVGYSIIIILFVGCAFSLIVFAVLELWHGINPQIVLPLPERFNSILECVALLTIAEKEH